MVVLVKNKSTLGYFIEFRNKTLYQKQHFKLLYDNNDNCYRHSSRLPKYIDIKWSNLTKNIEMYKALRWVIKSMLKYFN